MEQKALQIKKLMIIAITVPLMLSIIFLLRAYFNGQFASAETLRAYIGSYGVGAPLILTYIQAMQVIIPVLPGWLGCIVGAGMFGVAGGFWCNYIGISAGSIAAYYLARIYGKTLVEKMVSIERHQKLVDWVQTKKSYTVVFALAILLPLAPDDFLCYFSGLTDMSSRKFIWIVILAKPWCILIYSLIFANII
ncbi:MAG: VTT domain-containing protein [Lachnospiraceae bacterium]|nr:VTT domain-containing protein [Lachnospiraceae bacterium]